MKPEPVLPTVEVLVAAASEVSVPVASQGIVEPKTVTSLASEVAGRVLSVSAKLRAGGRFEAGESLLQIDDCGLCGGGRLRPKRPWRTRGLTLELRNGRACWAGSCVTGKKLGKGEGGRRPRAAEAAARECQRARVAAASAAADKARRDLERTRCEGSLRGPGPQPTSLTSVNLPRSRAQPVAEIYAAAPYEIRLPLSLEESLQADLARGTSKVVLSVPASPWAAPRSGEGTLTARQEGQVDRASRSLHVVALRSQPDAEWAESGPGVFPRGCVSTGSGGLPGRSGCRVAPSSMIETLAARGCRRHAGVSGR